jgi:hypothetical protein
VSFSLTSKKIEHVKQFMTPPTSLPLQVAFSQFLEHQSKVCPAKEKER